MSKLQKLQVEIEQTRSRLDKAMEYCDNMQDFYELNVELDRLIERYIDLSGDSELVN